MADKVAKPERDDAWWARMRREYIEKNDMLLGSFPDWEWIAPRDFYRTIFPEGFLQAKGEEIPWDEPGGGKPNGIAIQITHERREVKTKTGRVRESAVVSRFTLTDDLDGVDEIAADANAKNEAVFMAPVSYFGKRRVGKNARFLHAFAIDLDGVGPEQLGNVLKQIRNGYDPNLPMWTSLPQPTFIVNSGTGVHLYYVLDKPVPLVPKVVPFLQDFKEKLTDYVWRDTTSFLDEKQFQGIFQPYRMPGTPTKLNGKGPDSKRVGKYEAVAFVHRDPDWSPHLCTLDHLMDFAGFKNNRRDRDELLELMRNGGRTPMERARGQWPEWHDRRIEKHGEPGRWEDKRDLYEWWRRQVEEKATDGHRYWCLNVLAAYADKCGVPYEELEADALALVPHLESLTTRADNHFSAEDAFAAISSYGDGVIHRLTVDRIERRTQISMPRNKRNGRKQTVHLARARAVQQFDDPDGSWRNADGAPTKEELVREYALAHPEASHSEMARALGVSRTTVIKWLKQQPKIEANPMEMPDIGKMLDELYAAAMAAPDCKTDAAVISTDSNEDETAGK